MGGCSLAATKKTHRINSKNSTSLAVKMLPVTETLQLYVKRRMVSMIYFSPKKDTRACYMIISIQFVLF